MNQGQSQTPELHRALDWVNCDRQTLLALQGRVRVLLFWNASSAYCHTLIEQLMRLQARHPLGLCLFGIHLPKFDVEQDSRIVLKAANRLGINFPVANDRNWVAWQHFGVEAWPTLVLIDAAGNLRQILTGDLPGMVLESAIQELMAEDGVRQQPQEFTRKGAEPRSALAFPGGLAVTDSHVYVSDSGHHRVLECNHSGRIVREYGTGHADLVDGNADEAAFRLPRGLCLMRDSLYVADSGNHALRRINPVTGVVHTVLGNGRAGAPQEGKPDSPSGITLNQPWDVVGGQDRLFIAMAGCNQVWEYDLSAGRLRNLAGTGELGIADGPARSALLAQPAGLALVQQTLYVVDSAASAIRAVQISQGSVQTLVGQGLYEFGEHNGQRREARMQYPLALALDPASPVLWVADAYNGCLRRLRLGGGEMIRHDLPQALQRPVALAVGAGALWIADSEAHEVLRLDQQSGLLTRLPIGE